jgi:hypothetical protein
MGSPKYNLGKSINGCCPESLVYLSVFCTPMEADFDEIKL